MRGFPGNFPNFFWLTKPNKYWPLTPLLTCSATMTTVIWILVWECGIKWRLQLLVGASHTAWISPYLYRECASHVFCNIHAVHFSVLLLVSFVGTSVTCNHCVSIVEKLLHNHCAIMVWHCLVIHKLHRTECWQWKGGCVLRKKTINWVLSWILLWNWI